MFFQSFCQLSKRFCWFLFDILSDCVEIRLLNESTVTQRSIGFNSQKNTQILWQIAKRRTIVGCFMLLQRTGNFASEQLTEAQRRASFVLQRVCCCFRADSTFGLCSFATITQFKRHALRYTANAHRSLSGESGNRQLVCIRNDNGLKTICVR